VPLERLLPFLLFAALGLPLVWQDVKNNSVSMTILVAVFLSWSIFAFFREGAEGRLLATLVVMTMGSLLLLAFPGRLGEADVVFMSGMALLLPFWSLLIAFALGCIGTLSAFVWLSRKEGVEFLARPLPFLPSLYWAGLSTMLGEIRV